ncbi:MAG: hypothetical protein ACK4RN_07085 [Pseudorhodobacter sp.]
MPRIPFPILPALFVAASCGHFPEVHRAERNLPASQTAPVLVPVEDLLALDTAPRATEASVSAVEGRADRLRARAAALRRTPVSQP